MRNRSAVLEALVAVYLCAPVLAHATAIGDLHCNDPDGVSLQKGKVVTVSGTVTGQFSTEKNTRLYIQDATGGINVFGSPVNCAALGDSVKVTGVVSGYNGLTEITGTDAQALTIESLSRANVAVEPLRVTPLVFNAAPDSNRCEPNESRLVEVRDLVVRTATGGVPDEGAVFTLGANYRMQHAGPDSSTNFVTMRVEASAGCVTGGSLENSPIPIGTVHVVGILSQYKARSAKLNGYQLLPRNAGDLRSAEPPPVRGK